MKHKIRMFISRNRVVVVSVITGIASALLAVCLHFFKQGDVWAYYYLAAYAIVQGLLVFAASVQTFYSKVELIDSILPAIHRDLGLGPNDRISLHMLRDNNSQTYVQLTNYYPTKTGMGRVFHFTYGLTGRAFKTRLATAYSVVPNLTFNQALTQDWAYTNEERMRLTQDRRSFFAMPVGQQGELARAVIYMDSPDAATFEPANKDRISNRISTSFLPVIENLLNAS